MKHINISLYESDRVSKTVNLARVDLKFIFQMSYYRRQRSAKKHDVISCDPLDANVSSQT